MDLVSLAMNMSQIDLATKVSTSVTKLAMDDATKTATQMTNMMNEMNDPNLGNKIDTRV